MSFIEEVRSNCNNVNKPKDMFFNSIKQRILNMSKEGYCRLILYFSEIVGEVSRVLDCKYEEVSAKTALVYAVDLCSFLEKEGFKIDHSYCKFGIDISW